MPIQVYAVNVSEVDNFRPDTLGFAVLGSVKDSPV